MKKIILYFFTFAVALSFFVTPTFAKSGDIAGRFYATDIHTYLNGARIDAINIDGETLISAEDMRLFGFWVWWDNNERKLRVEENSGLVEGDVPLISENSIPAGTPIGYYYETDIITYLDRNPITAYNVGGRTYIHAEEMRNFGYTVVWSAEKWTLEITSPRRAGFVYDIVLANGENKCLGNGVSSSDASGVFYIKYTPEFIDKSGDADYFDLIIRSTGQGYQFDMAFYQNKALFNSETLINKLRPLCYDGYGVEKPYPKTEKYDIVNQVMNIYINGQRAEKISVLSGAGNGHRDFYFHVEDLPQYRLEEIEEIVISFG